MRILFTTTGHAGHVIPLVPFAHAALCAGHDVRVAAPSSRAAVAGGAGLPVWPFDDPPEDEVWSVFAATADLAPEPANAVVIGEVFGRLNTRAALPGVLALVETWRPDIVVRESYEFASALAAELHGIPHVRVATGLATTEDWLLAHAAAGLEHLPVDAIRRSPYLSLTPAALDNHAPARRFRQDSPPAQPLPDYWPGREGPLAYVTFGSVAAGMSLFPRLYRTALAELAEVPARVLLTIGELGEPAELGPLPPNVHVERWIPQNEVLAHADVVVCHGGYGTTTGALSHGVPLVVTPIFADQLHNARRVVEVGAGLALRPAESISAAAAAPLEGLGDRVRRVLGEPAFRDAARRIADSAATASPISAAPRLLGELAGGSALPRAA
jgi:UDP:flavonoid glycosyltransferase YjiC (YdhE family)